MDIGEVEDIGRGGRYLAAEAAVVNVSGSSSGNGLRNGTRIKELEKNDTRIVPAGFNSRWTIYRYGSHHMSIRDFRPVEWVEKTVRG